MARQTIQDTLVAPILCGRRTFPGRPAELARLRRWLASLLPDSPARDDVITVTVELASNAIKHTASGTGGRFTVELTCVAEPGTVAVAVTDAGAPAGPAWPANPDPLNGHGLGLLLVRSLAARSGVCGDSRGRLVWAEFSWLSDTADPPLMGPRVPEETSKASAPSPGKGPQDCDHWTSFR
jgi:Histidine kinase-like ATPase domain